MDFRDDGSGQHSVATRERREETRGTTTDMKDHDDAHAATLGADDDGEVRIATNLIAERIPAVLGDRYRVGELLGSGSFGSVFKAVDDRLQKVVAVKLLDVRWAQREKDFER